jgi:glyoxylase I family protein
MTTGISSLDHVNILTDDIGRMSRFYADVLGLPKGTRPHFSSSGAWHYCRDTAVVHLVDHSPGGSVDRVRIEHFAFRGAGLADFLAHLRTHQVGYQVNIVPDLGLKSVNVYDPEGNHIEVIFEPAEEADIFPYQPVEAE